MKFCIKLDSYVIRNLKFIFVLSLLFAASARESSVCLVNMTSLTENETFPINLYGPQAFQAMRSGTSQESETSCFPSVSLSLSLK